MSKVERIYIGVDGGGTKTAIGAYDHVGKCLAHTVCPPLNYHVIGVDAALTNLVQGIASLGLAMDAIAAIGIGDPSIDDVGECEAANRFADEVKRLLACPVFIRSDAYMTLYGMTGGRTPGVLVISGTGAMALAENADGRILVAGGWGRLTGDEGSGYEIGLCGIRAALRAADGVSPPTMLTDAVLKHFGCDTPRALINAFYGDAEPNVAGFAKCVADCADAGDRAAAQILDNTAQTLADYTSVLIDRSGAEQVGVYGSVLCRNATVRARFESLLLARYPQISITEPSVCAEYAAAKYALDHCKGDFL
jgi:N-acetylglucosamine kinase-like BadF-type ATPase